MTIREAFAEWQGTLKEGGGRLRLGSGVFEGAYSFPSRFENGPGTNPEELIAAAHAGCFSMALTFILGQDGHVARSIRRSPASSSKRKPISRASSLPNSSAWRRRRRGPASSLALWLA